MFAGLAFVYLVYPIEMEQDQQVQQQALPPATGGSKENVADQGAGGENNQEFTALLNDLKGEIITELRAELDEMKQELIKELKNQLKTELRKTLRKKK